MKYEHMAEAEFLERQNRFVAYVLLAGRKEKVHVKNTGRCRELLRKGARVWLVQSPNPNRSTRYDLVAVKKGERLINMDSQAPNRPWRSGFTKGALSRSCFGASGDKVWQFQV